MLTVFALKTCDTCRKALKALETAGVAHTVVDIRAEADLASLAPAWIAQRGAEMLVNKRSTTWRSLSEAERKEAETAEGAASLLSANPTLVKRPVFVLPDGTVHIGWTAETQTALGL